MTARHFDYPDAKVQLFAKAPVPGRVKTRLIPLLGEGGAAALYHQLLERQLAMLDASRLCPVELWVDGDPDHPAFDGFRGERRRQQGTDLGDRLYQAAVRALAEAGCVVLIGSDCPGLDEAYLQQALLALAGGHELVLGPALDGGYVLIGLARAEEGLFRDVDWGSDAVLSQTLARARTAGLDYELLPALADIDTPQDLEILTNYSIYPTSSRRFLAEDS